VLKPHAGDEQKAPLEFVRVAFAGSDAGTLCTHLTQCLPDELAEPVATGRTFGVEIASQGNSHPEQQLRATAPDVRHRLQILEQLLDIQKLADGNHLLGAL